MKALDDSLLNAYEAKKKNLVTSLEKRFKRHPGNISLYKETSNLFRTSPQKESDRHIDLRSFNKVIHVDRDHLIAEVEGMTTYEDLVHETLNYGCLPTVVPELKSITIGGALAGLGIESSSFQYGLVHETIKEIEILLSSGQVVKATPENEYQDLFFAFPNSYGTFGYALKVKVQLIPAKEYVKLTHFHFSNPTLYFQELNRLCSENRKGGKFSFIEGVIFDRTKCVITLGQFVDSVSFTSDYKYRHIYYQSLLTKQEDYLTTLDYIWRWDADWFWCSKVFFMQNPLLRLIFGKWMLNSRFYTKMMRLLDKPWLSASIQSLRGKRESIIQDVLIPVQNAERFLEFFQNEIGIKPIWICPARPFSNSARYPLCALDPDLLYIDFGFWDSIPTDQNEGYHNRKIEKMVKELNGFKSLYSSSYYTEEEFWQIFDKKAYLQLKQKYDPAGLLRNLYEKSCARSNN